MQIAQIPNDSRTLNFPECPERQIIHSWMLILLGFPQPTSIHFDYQKSLQEM